MNALSVFVHRPTGDIKRFNPILRYPDVMYNKVEPGDVIELSMFDCPTRSMRQMLCDTLGKFGEYDIERYQIHLSVIDWTNLRALAIEYEQYGWLEECDALFDYYSRHMDSIVLAYLTFDH